MTEPTPKPVPRPNPETQPFWDACQRGELTLQRCSTCNHLQHYPRVRCTSCQGNALTQEPVSGAGVVRTFTINRVPVSEAYKADLPYVVALIELVEGPCMMANLLDCAPERVHIGMPVTVTFESRGDVMLPQFIPIETEVLS